VTNYTYDPVGRLLKAVTPDLTEIFAFDPAGNPVDPEKMTPPPVVETPQEKAERFARNAAEDAAWLRAHPDEKYPPLRHNKRGSEDATKLYEWRRSLPKCIGNVLAELNRVRYDYDERGNLIRRIELDGRTWLYCYDAANRLKEASRYTKTPDANELDRTEPLANGGVRYLNGTVRAERVVRFRYDVFGRRTLKEVEQAGGGIDRTIFTWDGDVLLMEERFHEPPRRAGDFRPYRYRSSHLVRDDPNDPHSLPVAQRMHTLYEEHQWQAASIYLHEPGSFVPLARLDETMVEPAHLATGTDGRFVQMPATTRHATLFYQNDHLGTPQELVDESGTVVWLARYKAWGGWKNTWKEKPDPAEAANALRFQGQYHDEETGLHYNRHRYYDPQTGRFISKDPIGLAGGINVYQYAPNPVQWIDPLGLTCTSAAKALQQLKGMSVARIEKTLAKDSFTLTKDNGKNANWNHADGSEVRIHRYGNQNPSGYKSGNNAHVHKQDPCNNQLSDRGIVTEDGDEKHIGIRNPGDLPTVRGRPHGDGS
jgi:RHS repeat-associated protein